MIKQLFSTVGNKVYFAERPVREYFLIPTGLHIRQLIAGVLILALALPRFLHLNFVTPGGRFLESDLYAAGFMVSGLLMWSTCNKYRTRLVGRVGAGLGACMLTAFFFEVLQVPSPSFTSATLVFLLAIVLYAETMASTKDR